MLGQFLQWQSSGPASISPAPSEGSNIDHEFVDPERSSNMLQGFSGLYESKMFCDVTLSVDSHEFPCHKNILAISSPFFMAMFKVFNYMYIHMRHCFGMHIVQPICFLTCARLAIIVGGDRKSI